VLSTGWKLDMKAMNIGIWNPSHLKDKGTIGVVRVNM
jgi:hypothetical protein